MADERQWSEGYCDGIWEAACILEQMADDPKWTPEQRRALLDAAGELADWSAK